MTNKFARRPAVTKRLKREIEVAIRFVCTPASRAAYAPIVTPCTMNVIAIAPSSLPDKICGVTAAITLCGVRRPIDLRLVHGADNAEPKIRFGQQLLRELAQLLGGDAVDTGFD